MITFACHTWAFADLTLTEALGTIARIGFAQVDLGSGKHLNPVKAAADEARVSAEIIGDLRVYHLQVSDVALLLPSLADRSEQSRELDLFSAVIPTLRRIQAAGVTIVTEIEGLTAVGPLIEALQAMVNAAEGLPLSVETRLTPMLADRLTEILTAVPKLQLTLDATQLDPELLSTWGPRLRHVIVTATPKVDALMTTLQAQAYHGTVAIRPIKDAHGRINPIHEAIRVRDLLKTYRH